jgi:hypothetical protein
MPGTNPAAKELAENCEGGEEATVSAALLSADVVGIVVGVTIMADVAVSADADAVLVIVPDGAGLTAFPVIFAQYDP